ncbi:MAG: outer membrane beta-barrel protein [Flavobacteriaceae bacterium]|nr:outer membrane beta-barrel protein [Flavobacteriaceae bacterium]
MKKKTDDIFKAKLGQYSEVPGPEMWSRIQKELDQRDRRRFVIPLWYRYAGVAAVGLLLLTLVLNQSLSTDGVVLQEPSNIERQETPVLPTTPERSSENSVANQNEIVEDLTEAIVATSSAKTTATESLYGVSSIQKDNPTQAPQGGDSKSPPPTDAFIERAPNTSNTIDQSATAVAVQNTETIDGQNLKPIQAGDQEADFVNNTTPEESTVVALTQEKIETEHDAQEPENTFNRTLIVAPMAGPVYYSSLSGGSAIDPFLNDNAKSGDVSFSYGVQVAMRWNEKLTIRTGINNINVGYATQGIEIATGPESFGLSAVNYADSGRIISVFDKGTFPSGPMNDPTNPYGQLSLKSSSGNPELRSSISYFEIPLEAQYQLIEGRVSLSLISGLSGLFLNNSEVTVSDNVNRYVLGALNNLNDFSFSTNIGLGIDYRLFSRVLLKIEPTFKYQIGAYSDPSIDFSPYQLGILSGLRLNF